MQSNNTVVPVITINPTLINELDQQENNEFLKRLFFESQYRDREYFSTIIHYVLDVPSKNRIKIKLTHEIMRGRRERDVDEKESWYTFDEVSKKLIENKNRAKNWSNRDISFDRFYVKEVLSALAGRGGEGRIFPCVGVIKLGLESPHILKYKAENFRFDKIRSSIVSGSISDPEPYRENFMRHVTREYLTAKQARSRFRGKRPIFFEEGGTIYSHFIMRRLGMSLGDYLHEAERGPALKLTINVDERIQLAIGVLEALRTLKTPFRDFKLDNLVMDAQKRVFLIDFGLAVLTQDDYFHAAGSFHYTPPEVAKMVLWGAVKRIIPFPFTMLSDGYTAGWAILELLGGSRDPQCPSSMKNRDEFFRVRANAYQYSTMLVKSLDTLYTRMNLSAAHQKIIRQMIQSMLNFNDKSEPLNLDSRWIFSDVSKPGIFTVEPAILKFMRVLHERKVNRLKIGVKDAKAIELTLMEAFQEGLKLRAGFIKDSDTFILDPARALMRLKLYRDKIVNALQEKSGEYIEEFISVLSIHLLTGMQVVNDIEGRLRKIIDAFEKVLADFSEVKSQLLSHEPQIPERIALVDILLRRCQEFYMTFDDVERLTLKLQKESTRLKAAVTNSQFSLYLGNRQLTLFAASVTTPVAAGSPVAAEAISAHCAVSN